MKCWYLVILIGVNSPIYGQTLTGRVVKVIDGDTVTILDNQFERHKIRLTGIDAPEHSQAFQNVSTNSLSDLIYNKTVTVEFYKLDRNKRILGKILLNGQDMNNEQLKRGMAWFYTQYQNNLNKNDRRRYKDSEAYAISHMLAYGQIQCLSRLGSLESKKGIIDNGPVQPSYEHGRMVCKYPKAMKSYSNPFVRSRTKTPDALA